MRFIPSNKISGLFNTHKPQNNNFIFVGTVTHRYVYTLLSAIFPEDIEKYYNDKRIFLELLPISLLEKCLYKPYVELGWREVDYIRTIAGGQVKLVNQEDGHTNTFPLSPEWMKKCKMAVVDYAGSSYFEALAVNIPTVLYWDHDIYQVLPEFEPQFQALRDAAILFRDPESAAKHFTNVYDDPNPWWLNEDTQAVRMYFLNSITKPSENWMHEWAIALKGVLHEAQHTSDRK